jgi:uncharacterized protein YqeY
MCKAFHGRSGLHPTILPEDLKCLARQMMAANGGVLLRISGVFLPRSRNRLLACILLLLVTYSRCYLLPMPNFVEQLSEDIKNAMRAKDTVALNTLRALKTALTNASIEKGGLGTPLDDAECLVIVRRQVKQRQDSIMQFEKADRAELADNEKKEITYLEKYLPAALTEAELAALLDQAVADTGATGKADMGKLIKRMQELTDGRADGRTISAAVAKRLS